MSVVEGTSTPVTGCQSYSNKIHVRTFSRARLSHTSLFQLKEYFVLWQVLVNVGFLRYWLKGKQAKWQRGTQEVI